MQHRQIEAAAVPGDDIGGVFLDAVEEALNDFVLRRIGRAQCPDAETVALAQRAGNGNNTVLMMRQKLAAVLLAAFVKSDVGDIFCRRLCREVE